ncbi:MAG: beta-galactosidase, partial [Chloroflexi bacterium]|nr:beta-galactosidase [Chloroflexota bacterium]
MPDKVPLDAALAEKVRAFLQGGGKVIASYRAGLRANGSEFALSEWGVRLVGPSPFAPDYLRARPELGADLPDAEHVMYEPGLETQPLAGSTILADTFGPYFNRTWDHFCSHRQTPPDLMAKPRFGAIIRNEAGNVIYFANPIFMGYRRQAVLWYKKLFLAALRLLLPDPLVICQGPSTLQVTLLRQTWEGDVPRTVVHLLHYIPERRGLEFDTVEDVIPLYNVALAFRTAQAP